MSNRLITLVYSRRFGLGSVKAVALKLADVARDDGTSIYPSLATISRDTEFCLRVVRAAMRQLETMKVLVLVSPGGGRNKAATYRLNLDALSLLPAVNPAADAGYLTAPPSIMAKENPATDAPLSPIPGKFFHETRQQMPPNPY